MTDPNTISNRVELTESGKPVLPSTLNVLTILTFIGSGVALIFVLLTPLINRVLLSFMEKAQSSGRELTAKELTEIEKGKAAIELTQANLVPLLSIGLISIILCIVGAIWMRKLKKDGFWIYLGGELLPVIGNLILLGTAPFTGVFSILIGAGIPVLFVILYANQRKYLIK